MFNSWPSPPWGTAGKGAELSEAAGGALGGAWEAPGVLGVHLSPGTGDDPLLFRGDS